MGVGGRRLRGGSVVRVEGADRAEEVGYLREIQVVNVRLVEGSRLADPVSGGVGEGEVGGVGSVRERRDGEYGGVGDGSGCEDRRGERVRLSAGEGAVARVRSRLASEWASLEPDVDLGTGR